MWREDDPCAILGISPSADAKAINDAYRKLALRYHPDVFVANTTTNNGRRSRDENRTFERLTDARERALRRVGSGGASHVGDGYAHAGGYTEWRDATRYGDFRRGRREGETPLHQKYDHHAYERRRHPVHGSRQYGGGVLLLWSLSLVTFGSFLYEISRAEHKVGPETEKRREKRRKEEFMRREKAREIGRMERASVSGGSSSSKRKKKKVVPEMMSMTGNSRHVATLDEGGVLFVEDEEEDEERFDRKGYYERTTKNGQTDVKFKRVKPIVSKHAERTKANALAQKNLSEEEIEKAMEQMRTMEREIECCAKCGWPLPYQSTMSCPACGARTVQKRDVVRVVVNKKLHTNGEEKSSTVETSAASNKTGKDLEAASESPAS